MVKHFVVTNWYPFGHHILCYPHLMANPKLYLRLEQIMHAYLEELADIGTYGKGKNGVAKRFIEDGVQRAIETKTITKRSAKDHETES